MNHAIFLQQIADMAEIELSMLLKSIDNEAQNNEGNLHLRDIDRE